MKTQILQKGDSIRLSPKARVKKQVANQLVGKFGIVIGYNSLKKTWHVKFSDESFHLKRRDIEKPYTRPYARKRPEQPLLWEE